MFIKHACAAALLGAALGAQALTVQLQGPADLSAQPGDTVGWGFVIGSDATDWVTFIGSVLVLESTPTLGVYTDFIGLRGGPVDFALPPAVVPYLQFFDAPTLQGLGSYRLDPGAPVGDSNNATLRVLFERYSSNPLQCGADCYLGTDQADLRVSVAAAGVVVTPVPEPAPLALVGAALGVMALLKGCAARRQGRGRSVPRWRDNAGMKPVVNKVQHGEQAAADLAFWLAQPMAERIAAVEALRQQALGEKVPGDAEQRLQRICRVAKRPRR